MELIQLTFLGLCAGSMLGLSAQGLVLIYRGSGVLNLAHASIGTLTAFIYWDLKEARGLPFLAAFLIALAVSALFGYLMHVLVIKPLKRASTIAKLVATLGVLVVIQSGLQLYYGADQRIAAPVLPQQQVHIAGIAIGADRLILLGISAAVAVVLYLVYKYTRFGIATTATAENPRAAASLGLSPGFIAGVNWAAGAGLAGLASILLAPIMQVQLVTQGALIVPVLAAALVGSMRSFSLTFVGGAIIGIAQALAGRYIDTPGWPDAVPFILMIIVLLLRGRGLSARPEPNEIRPGIGSGRIRPLWVAAVVAIMVVLIQFGLTISWVDAVILTICVSLILLSSVVVTGYAGQLSLCQFGLAGVGAVICGLLVSKWNFPFVLALIVSVAICFPIGLIVGLPALRTRGMNLAVATLGLAAALQSVLFVNPQYTGGEYLSVPSPTFLGIDIDSFSVPTAYAYFCLGVLLLFSLAVANLRRGGSGRRLIAMRSNERAAAALGVNVFGAKLFAFAFASSIAAAGGILLVFRQTNLAFNTQFTHTESINGVLYSVIGGVGFVIGPILGSFGKPAGIIPTIFHGQSDTFALWVAIVLGIGAIRLVADAPDGFVGLVVKGFHNRVARLRKGRTGLSKESVAVVEAANRATADRTTVEPHVLEIRDVTVGFGGVIALDSFSAKVEPGKILGVIGPNGAGKTTLIEAVTGFLKPRAGTILFDGRPMDGVAVHQRVRGGLGRTFQSLELFDDVTVLENLRAAADSRSTALYATDLVWPRQTELPPAALAAVSEFDLADDLDKKPTELSYGRRRLVAIARSVAGGPSILCLDEPAAGLSSTERRELALLMRRLAEQWGMGLILIEHDVDLVMSVCDEVVAINFGKTIARGAPAEVRANPDVIAAYLGGGEDPSAPSAELSTAGLGAPEGADR